MQVLLFRSEDGTRNFGDELNALLWPTLIPHIVELRRDTTLYGIGTLLNGTLREPAVVCGTGAGYHASPSNILSKDVEVLAVRGPRSARYLGLHPSLSATDPAILLALNHARQPTQYPVSLVPRWTAFNYQPNMVEQLEAPDLHVIDPRRPVEDVLAEISRSKLVLAEAFHGAVVADALRIPWIPLYTPEGAHLFKWLDWYEAMHLGTYDPADLAVRGTDWIVKNYEPRLSEDFTHSARLSQMVSVVKALEGRL